MWIVIRGRMFADRADVWCYGTFDSEEAASAFIEDAHDPEEHGPGGAEECNHVHLMHDDVEYAEVMYVNKVQE